jgi:hypothetical protein
MIKITGSEWDSQVEARLEARSDLDGNIVTVTDMNKVTKTQAVTGKK